MKKYIRASKTKYIVEDKDCNPIVEFGSEAERQQWLDENVDSKGYTKDGTRVFIWEKETY